jgi:hypothetical protein
VVRKYIDHAQGNWAILCPVLELMLNSRTSTTTGFSPFFLAHGFDNSPFPELPEATSPHEWTGSESQRGEAIARQIKQAVEWAQAAMAYKQEQQQQQANRLRIQTPEYRVNDEVWLDLRNIKTTRVSKKFDVRNAKFRVTKIVGSHVVQLNVPWRTKKFHVDLLRPVSQDPFPSQQSDDSHPPPILVPDSDGEVAEEWEVEAIVGERYFGKTDKRKPRRTKYIVKWIGYSDTSEEPLMPSVNNTIALERWLERTKHVRKRNDKLKSNWNSLLSQPERTS